MRRVLRTHGVVWHGVLARRVLRARGVVCCGVLARRVLRARAARRVAAAWCAVL